MASATEDLKRVPLFSGLSERQLKQLASHARKRELPPGTAVVQEQQMSGIGFFVITEGEGSVTVEGQELLRMGPGDFFGELALIRQGPRGATVTAETRMECLEIPFWDFREFVMKHPDVMWKLLEHVVELLSPDPPTRTV